MDHAGGLVLRARGGLLAIAGSCWRGCLAVQLPVALGAGVSVGLRFLRSRALGSPSESGAAFLVVSGAALFVFEGYGFIFKLT